MIAITGRLRPRVTRGKCNAHCRWKIPAQDSACKRVERVRFGNRPFRVQIGKIRWAFLDQDSVCGPELRSEPGTPARLSVCHHRKLLLRYAVPYGEVRVRVHWWLWVCSRQAIASDLRETTRHPRASCRRPALVRSLWDRRRYAARATRPAGRGPHVSECFKIHRLRPRRQRGNQWLEPGGVHSHALPSCQRGIFEGGGCRDGAD
jgi:hypothetical protein